MMFKRATIIGLGLIGSSLARAMRAHNLATTIVGCDANEVSLAFARKEGFIDIAMSDAAEAVKGSDLIFIATPPATLEHIAKTIAPHVGENVIVMDTVSVKQPAIAAIAPHLPAHCIFIPAHPIAGSEHAGVHAGRADLFEKKRIILTPDEPPEPELLKHINAFWQAMGARVEGMPADIHDMLYGYMSHLPQLLAFALKAPLGEFLQHSNDPIFASFTRLTRSSPALWSEIFDANLANVLPGIDRYIDALAHVAGELKNAPEGEASDADPLLAHTKLFPRIVASCLVTTVMEAEKKAGFAFARYAGTGFADVTAPTLTAPEDDIERISAQYRLVAGIIDDFLARLKQLREVLAHGDRAAIEQAIT